jgi:hypothetical protein
MTHLILTVGTGTAGKHSNLAAGLRRTVELISPDKFWLIPSTDEVSQLTAELVSEGMSGFQPWSDGQPCLAITQPDSLEVCRTTVREVIILARSGLPRSGRLLVNPTSGTKQMSVGAALAALDEGIGELVFTVGKRADGVVMTGTEQLESFAAQAYFAERDLKTAMALGAAGSFSAAATLLSPHATLTAQTDTALCLREWERQNYAEARRIAAGSQALAPFRNTLESLAKAAKAPEPHPVIISDLLLTAGLLHGRRDFEAALTLTCRSLEMGLRRALFEKTKLHEPYSLPRICALPLEQAIKDRCRNASLDGQRTILNLNTVARILQQLGHDLGDDFFADRELQALVRVRNDLMHQLRSVTEAESEAALQRVKKLFLALKLPVVPERPVLS